MRWLGLLLTEQQASWLQVLKTSVAIVVAWFASQLLLGVPMPIFAAIAALLVVAPSVNQSVGKGLERSAGVLGGVVLAWLAGLVEAPLGLQGGELVVLVVVVAAVVLARLLRLAPMAANQVPISAMIMLALGAGAGPEYGLERIVETLIGALCALAVNVAIVPPVHHEPAERRLRELAHAIADAFDRVAGALAGESGDAARLLADARALRGRIAAARAAMDALEDSLRLNPRKRGLGERIERDERLLLALTILTNRVIGMSRTIADRADALTADSLAGEPIVERIREESRRIAHEVRALVDRHAHADGRTTTMPALDGPLLTSPIVVPAPHPEHWVLVGALLEDLRQARESLEAGDEGV